jgi:glutamine amidotransferase
MKDLEETNLIPVIKEYVASGKLLIGICLGMQLLFDQSSEYGITKGLSFIPGNVEEFNISLKVPHMGWNSLSIKINDPITKYIKDEDYVYFIHSYYAITDSKYIIANTTYEVSVPAIVRKDNVIGMQFHPEKSGQVGLRLLQALKELIPC